MTNAHQELVFDELTIYPSKRNVKLNEEIIELTTKEFESTPIICSESRHSLQSAEIT